MPKRITGRYESATAGGEKVDAFIKLMEPLGLVDVCRTGIVAISRGPNGV